jgi:hypothetical protein
MNLNPIPQPGDIWRHADGPLYLVTRSTNPGTSLMALCINSETPHHQTYTVWDDDECFIDDNDEFTLFTPAKETRLISQADCMQTTSHKRKETMTKVYTKSVILAAIQAKINEAGAIYARASETIQTKLGQALGDYTAALADSALCKVPDPIVVKAAVPVQGYTESLAKRDAVITATADLPDQPDSVVLDETEALNLLTGDIPTITLSFRIGA